MVAVVKRSFAEQFHSEASLVVRSPGRINLIGEHTDYNEGFVLPAAIDKAIYLAISRRPDSKIKLYSIDYQEIYEGDQDTLAPSEQGWANYVLGVVDQLRKKRLSFSGFNLILSGDVPLGAGLSSSAAVECAAIFALDQLFQLNLNRKTMAFLAQAAEHTFAGVQCGIMDQFASLFGKKDAAINLDCRTLDFEYIPVKLEGYQILLLNTNVKHSLASTAYNERRQACEQGVAWIREKYPAIGSLRDTTIPLLEECIFQRNPLIYKRCRYVVEEIQRTKTACDLLKTGNLERMGKLMFETHEGLSKAYQVSCPELDFLVDFVKNKPYVAGARMMGGGFGGCTINLVKTEWAAALVEEIGVAYEHFSGLPLTAHPVAISEGTSQVV
jgi:galactokinase